MFWLYLPGYILAVPAAVIATQQWRRARRAERDKEADEQRRERQHEVNQMVAAALRVLTGTDNLDEIHEPSLANPSIRESLNQALEETAALAAAIAMLRESLERHASDNHGQPIPEWMWRAAQVRIRGNGA